MNAQKAADVTAKLLGNESMTEDVKRVTCKLLDHDLTFINNEYHRIANNSLSYEKKKWIDFSIAIVISLGLLACAMMNWYHLIIKK